MGPWKRSEPPRSDPQGLLRAGAALGAGKGSTSSPRRVRFPRRPPLILREVEPVNKLKQEKQEAILSALVEGASVRSVERMTGVHRDTIGRLLLRVGQTCEEIMDETMRDLPCQRIEL